MYYNVMFHLTLNLNFDRLYGPYLDLHFLVVYSQTNTVFMPFQLTNGSGFESRKVYTYWDYQTVRVDCCVIKKFFIILCRAVYFGHLFCFVVNFFVSKQTRFLTSHPPPPPLHTHPLLNISGLTLLLSIQFVKCCTFNIFTALTCVIVKHNVHLNSSKFSVAQVAYKAQTRP